MRARAVLVAVTVLVASLGTVGVASANRAAVGVGTGSSQGALQTGSQGTGAVQEDCSFPVSATDTTETEVTVAERPERIVVLQPSDAQITWAVGAQDRVVGMPVTAYTEYLDGRSGRTNVKNEEGTVNVEQVVGLNPDLVLAANVTSIDTVRQLRSAGVTVYHFENVESLAGIAENIETVGQLTGNCEGGEREAAQFRERVETVRRAAEMAEERPPALYYFFGFTAGADTHIGDVIETAGAENVATAAGIDGYQRISAEVVASRDPAWIVYPDSASLPTGAPYNGTTALRENQTVELNSNFISQPGPRVVVPLTRLARTFHPEAYERANASTPTPTPTPSPSPSPVTTGGGGETPATTTAAVETPTSPTNTATDGPGMGALGAVAALVLTTLALLAGRRD